MSQIPGCWWLLMRDWFDNLSKLGKVEVPVLVRGADADAVIPFAHGKPLAEGAQDGTLLSGFLGQGTSSPIGWRHSWRSGSGW